MTATESNPSEAQHQNPDTAATESSAPPFVQLYFEDLAATSLLRLGRPLKTTEIIAAAQGISLPRTSLAEGLRGSTLVVQHEREWNLALRTSRAHLSREERDRQPLETTISELLQAVGKPLPVPVIARELTFLRGAFLPNFKDLAAGALRNARWAVEVAPATYIHEKFLLDAYAPTAELIIRANNLEIEPDFAELNALELPPATGNNVEDTVAILRIFDGLMSLKLLGFLLWKQDPDRDPQVAARAISDRSKFYLFTGGAIILQELLPALRGAVQAWAEEQAGGAVTQVDVAALLRQRSAQHAAPAREFKADIMEDLKALARRSAGQPVSLAVVMTDVLEIEPEDPQFVSTLQALNDKLRSDSEFLPIGIGQFLLRESVPTYVGETPDELRPVQLAVNDRETNEPLDFEMSDDGLEGDAADFVHDPQWDDVGEGAEVKLVRKPADVDTTAPVRYIILNHHYRAGTMKLRRADEDFFGISGPLTRLNVLSTDGAVEAWASRESGLIYGLGKWYESRTPPSGGVLSFAREGNNRYFIQVEAPDKLTLIEGRRAEELENLREAARYMSLFELLQTIMNAHGNGMELSSIWAEVNMVRRTSKRLLCSVLSGYHCYYFKQRGPKQILWRFDASKLDQGFKRNKRKYVRR
jgi:hypothetical protein